MPLGIPALFMRYARRLPIFCFAFSAFCDSLHKRNKKYDTEKPRVSIEDLLSGKISPVRSLSEYVLSRFHFIMKQKNCACISLEVQAQLFIVRADQMNAWRSTNNTHLNK